MAWQLIYTSAPRLLEAGRSGFGTVARHRDIPPLVVAAVERISQFSRQQGLDPARIIYAHRILSISGQRFHVLSCIRDAGADYTGRTNHLAHHLIAESHEVASLGISSADVLMQMPWLAAWTEQPRWLEVQETIPLASFPSATGSDGARWGAVTGDPRHAQLLANGDASHGCYLVAPANTDLRPLLAESLNLARERRWQVAFTTSLQPSDEPTDFRWLGLEVTSPLRAATETSGRIVLDLARPHALPAPPAPPTPATPRIERASSTAQSSVVEPAPQSTASRPASAAPVFSDDRCARQKEQAFEAGPTRSVPKKSSKWRWVTAAAVVLLIFAIVAGVQIHQGLTLRTMRDDFFAHLPRFATRNQDSRTAFESLKWGNRDAARKLDDAAQTVWNTLKEEPLDKLNPAPLKTALDEARNASPPLTVSGYQKLLTVTSTIIDRRDSVKIAKPKDMGIELDEKLWKSLLDPLVDPPDPNDGLQKCRDELQGLWLKREADALANALRDNRDQQLSAKQFEGILQELSRKNLRTDVESLALTRASVSDWRDFTLGKSIVPQKTHPEWMREMFTPKKLVDRSEKPPSSKAPDGADKPQKKQTAPVYLSIEAQNLSTLRITELQTNVEFELAENDTRRPLRHINNTLRRGPQDPAAFLVDLAAQTISAGDAPPKAPFLLHLRNSGQLELCQIRVLSKETSDPAFPPVAKGLTRRNQQLLIQLDWLPRHAMTKLSLKIPGLGDLPVIDGAVALTAAIKINDDKSKDLKSDLEKARQRLDQNSNPSAAQDNLTTQCRKVAGFLPKDSKIKLPEEPGQGLVMLGRLLKDYSNSHPMRGAGAESDQLFKVGSALESPSKDMPQAEAANSAKSIVSIMRSRLKTEKEKKSFGTELLALEDACKAAVTLLSMTSVNVDREKALIRTSIEEMNGQLKAAQSHWLASDSLPSEDCLLFGESNGIRVPLSLYPAH